MIRLTAYNYMAEIKGRVNEDVRVYFCPGSGKEVGDFRKTGTKAM